APPSRRTRPAPHHPAPAPAPAPRAPRAVPRAAYGSSSSGPAPHRAHRPRPAGPPSALPRTAPPDAPPARPRPSPATAPRPRPPPPAHKPGPSDGRAHIRPRPPPHFPTPAPTRRRPRPWPEQTAESPTDQQKAPHKPQRPRHKQPGPHPPTPPHQKPNTPKPPNTDGQRCVQQRRPSRLSSRRRSIKRSSIAPGAERPEAPLTHSGRGHPRQIGGGAAPRLSSSACNVPEPGEPPRKPGSGAVSTSLAPERQRDPMAADWERGQSAWRGRPVTGAHDARSRRPGPRPRRRPPPLSEREAASPLAKTPYDLRHAAVSTRLGTGVLLLRSPDGRGTAWPSCCGSTQVRGRSGRGRQAPDQ